MAQVMKAKRGENIPVLSGRLVIFRPTFLFLSTLSFSSDCFQTKLHTNTQHRAFTIRVYVNKVQAFLRTFENFGFFFNR